MEAEDGLNKFIEDMLVEKDLPGITPEAKDMLVVDLKQRLMDQINRSIIDAMPDDKIDEFDTLLDKEGVDDNQLQQFIVDAGVDVKQETIKTMLAFRLLYLQNSGEREE